jgi:tellurite resistance protein TerC
MTPQVWLWIIFNVSTISLLILDIKISSRKQEPMSIKEALLWSAGWISLALLFNGVIYWLQGPERAMTFFTCYLIEESLSMDNMFVFLMIFNYFKVPPQSQHKVLFYGILGAVVMRFIFIFLGVTLVEKFHWLIYLFGAFLVFTGIKMLTSQDKEIHPDKNPVVRFFCKYFPVTGNYEGRKFFVVKNEKKYFTTLFIVVLVVMTSDLLFAVDSIPAVIAITQDLFLVYTSNILAIMGLRALFFVLSGMMDLFYYLQQGLSIILIFIGTKMILDHFFPIPVEIALGVVAGILAISVIASLLRLKYKT